MLARGLLRGCLLRVAVPRPVRVVAQVRGFAATTPVFADKAFGKRQHRVRKEDTQPKRGEEQEDFDEDEAATQLVEDSKELDEKLEGIKRKYEHTCRHLATMSKGGTSGIETLLIDNKPLTHYASISSQGLVATINVFHQVNILKVKHAITTMDASLEPKVGLTPTTLVVNLPRMTRDKRETLIASAKEGLEQTRKEVQLEGRALLAQHKATLKRLHPTTARQFQEDVLASEKECAAGLTATFKTCEETILPPQ